MVTGSPKPVTLPDQPSSAPSAIAVTNVASATTAGGTVLITASAARKELHIRNIDASITVYIGNTGLTSSTGYKLAAGEEKIFKGPIAGIAWYSLSASGTPAIQLLAIT